LKKTSSSFDNITEEQKISSLLKLQAFHTHSAGQGEEAPE